MLMIEYKDIGWWYWLVTAGLLTFGISGDPAGFLLAIALTIIQLVHFLFRERSITAFPVQVRIWYLVLLLVAWQEPLQWIYWIPAIGTWAQVIVGYCAMARCVSLLPWNRSEELSFDLLMKTFFSRALNRDSSRGAGDFVNR